ncbi:uncharacterized protein [Venturia canescens]|uniref:uncharacterized protein n=1 Tax=Venturia canescens TaxID=32260 RepID=UPI001C9C2394|nr:uncharacterized protein LOC122412284 [Venturia canescens]
MKFGIAVYILGFVAFHEVSCEPTEPYFFPASMFGNCTQEHYRNMNIQWCHRIGCTQTEHGIRFATLSCQLGNCLDGRSIGSGPYDLTKKYPHCCPPVDCD